MVAALESLGRASEPQPSSWSENDQQKRERIDQVTKGLGQKRKDQIQAAIMSNEHLALQRRFVAFVLSHVEPSFYRSEAVDAVGPIAAPELPAALRQAYPRTPPLQWCFNTSTLAHRCRQGGVHPIAF
jgi:hypothetical protein